MSKANLQWKRGEARTIYTKTSAATLTEAEIMNAMVVANGSLGTVLAITLPTYAQKYKACDLWVCGRHTGGTVTVTLTGNTSTNDKVTILGGELVFITCDGSSWYANSQTGPA